MADQRGFLKPSPLTLLLIFIFLTLLNLAVLNYQLFFKKEKIEESKNENVGQSFNFSPSPQAQESQVTGTSGCGSDCLAAIDAKVASLKEDLLKYIKQNLPRSSTSKSSPTTNQPKEIFINFGVNGTTTATDWIDLSGSEIDFDVSSYPGARFYFQANLKSDAGDRAVYARIYDTNNKIGVQGSNMSYTGLSSALTESGSMTFWQGRLKIRVQIKSLIGNLATIENPRIRIVY
ncbi:hypothetical protein HYS93_03870 [Candidatus Daviesbacteria bacterium]|nr:hypothetical protein [Candidatus Daviesbacteria bacterium]